MTAPTNARRALVISAHPKGALFLHFLHKLWNNRPDDLFRQPGRDPELPSHSFGLAEDEEGVGRGFRWDESQTRLLWRGPEAQWEECRRQVRSESVLLFASCDLGKWLSLQASIFSMQNGVNICNLKLPGTQ